MGYCPIEKELEIACLDHSTNFEFTVCLWASNSENSDFSVNRT